MSDLSTARRLIQEAWSMAASPEQAEILIQAERLLDGEQQMRREYLDLMHRRIGPLVEAAGCPHDLNLLHKLKLVSAHVSQTGTTKGARWGPISPPRPADHDGAPTGPQPAGKGA